MDSHIKKTRVRSLFYATLFSIFFLSYAIHSWWQFPLCTLILFTLFYFTNNHHRLIPYLKLTKATAIIAILIFIALYYFLEYTIHHTTQLQGIIMIPTTIGLKWDTALGFQVLNEEIMLRAVLLQLFFTRFRSRIKVSIIVAIFFALLHFAFYFLAQGAILSLSALTSLFVFFLIFNLIYYWTGHIWFGVAFHLAWNLTRFTHYFYWHGKRLEEGALFNYIEGSGFSLVMLLTILTLVCSIRYISKHFHPKARTTT
jgi:membrane protease YdiL (CAAX protease family)